MDDFNSDTINEPVNQNMEAIHDTITTVVEETQVDEDENLKLALLPEAERNARAEANKPDISWLDDAIDWDSDSPSGVGFLLKKNDYVVIERRALQLPGSPWLDTRVYYLTADPAENGNLKLQDPARQQMAQSNWKVGLLKGFQFRRPPPGTNPETLIDANGKIQRRKRLKVIMASAVVDPNVPKRGRGRPKGIKNRPKEIIEAEKAERRAEQDKKRQNREAKRRGYR